MRGIAEKTMADFRNAKVGGWENHKLGLEAAFAGRDKAVMEAR